MPDIRNNCAREMMDTVPQIMQSIRVEMRQGHGASISIPQFRTLRFVQAHPESSLTMLADNLGLTLPSVSKLIDGLVKQELILRRESSSDRRCLTLALTSAGEQIVNLARANTQASLAGSLAALSETELEIVQRAMQLLRPLFKRQENKPE